VTLGSVAGYGLSMMPEVIPGDDVDPKALRITAVITLGG
jgi:hypothetical protein